MIFRVFVRVTPRVGILDPQGHAVEQALTTLGFTDVREVRIGRAIEVTVEAVDAAAATAQARRMCEVLLANPVTEDFTLTVDS